MKKLLSIFCVLMVLFTACKDSDPPLADNLVSFQTDKQGFTADQATAEIKLVLSRNTDVAVPVTVTLQGSGVTYGTQFTTEPAAANNSLTVTIPAGSNSASIKVNKAANLFLNGTESITLKIASAGQPVVVGTTPQTQLSFSSIVSTGTQLTLDGGTGGASAINSVFVDLSANKQTSIAREDWDLGFYSGTDFRVILNNTLAASAVATTKTDINAVSAADVNLSNLEVGFGKGTFGIIDDINGDLTKTVIPAISVTDADNKVYIINRKGGSGTTLPAADLIKIRVLRSSNSGYTVQYAKINETTFQTLSIAKDSQYNFRYMSFAKGAVEVEPTKANWDIEWTYSIYTAGTVPYAFSDLVFVNHHGGVQTAEVLTSAVAYDAYAESNIATTIFTSNRNAISSNWRVTSGGTVGVKTDRFYVIKDASGNVYKMKFISFGPDGGTRGYPVLTYALVKKA
ncbi:HmuY family protein [Mucilaginibacter lacusdianchii]|uniref:HmuY family protein n=1 Tax=Mucilaginibacter lacusdianchii TaxID=2684211 RepID=UPI00131B8A51|nr:HmuY family protein [Mucilaginibacter sp. JXJ CY 39]